MLRRTTIISQAIMHLKGTLPISVRHTDVHPKANMSDQAKPSGPHHDFTCSGSRRPSSQKEKERDVHTQSPLTDLWLGLAATKLDDGRVKIGFACHDGTYTMDFAVDVLSKYGNSGSIGDHLIYRIGTYAERNSYRYLGAAVSEQLLELCPDILSRLWADLDIVPIIVKTEGCRNDVDEVADSMARKCVM